MIVDCFIFNNEFSLLSARLNYLNPAVDKFLIVESSYTFTGIYKPFQLKFYISQNFQHMAHKIIVLENGRYLSSKVEVQEIGELLSYPASLAELEKTIEYAKVDCRVWLNDGFQRELLANLIDQHCDESDIVIISDVDEIPSLAFVNCIQACSSFEINFAEMMQYRYDVHFRDKSVWIGSVATRRSTVLSEGVNQLRFFTKRGLNHLNYRIINGGGWHLTSLGSPDEIKNKISSWGHQELNTPINRLMLKFRIQRGLDIFGRQMEIIYTDHPNIPSQILTQLSFNYLHSYKSPSCLEKALNIIACYADRAYRRIRALLYQFNLFK